MTKANIHLKHNANHEKHDKTMKTFIPVGLARTILKSNVRPNDTKLFAQSYTCKNKDAVRSRHSRVTVQPGFRCNFREINSFAKHKPAEFM